MRENLQKLRDKFVKLNAHQNSKLRDDVLVGKRRITKNVADALSALSTSLGTAFEATRLAELVRVVTGGLASPDARETTLFPVSRTMALLEKARTLLKRDFAIELAPPASPSLTAQVAFGAAGADSGSGSSGPSPTPGLMPQVYCE